MAARKLVALGYKKVCEYVEGTQDWLQAALTRVQSCIGMISHSSETGSP